MKISQAKVVIENRTGRILRIADVLEALAGDYRNEPEALERILEAVELTRDFAQENANIRRDMKNPVALEFIEQFYREVEV